MANPERGEITATIDGKTYTFVLNTAAIVRAERRYSTPAHHMTLVGILQLCDNGSVDHMAGLLWSAAQKYQPGMSEDEIYTLIDHLGLDRLRDTLQEAAASTNPDPRDLPPEAASPIAAQGAVN
jgi:hypothetical protein